MFQQILIDTNMKKITKIFKIIITSPILLIGFLCAFFSDFFTYVSIAFSDLSDVSLRLIAKVFGVEYNK